MDTKTAFIEVRQMLTHLRAFQSVEEVLQAAIAAEAYRGDLERSINRGKAELVRLNGEVESANLDVKKAKVLASEAVQVGEAAVATAERDAISQVSSKQDEVTAAIKTLIDIQSEAEGNHSVDMARMKGELDEMGREKAKLEKALSGLKARIKQA